MQDVSAITAVPNDQYIGFHVFDDDDNVPIATANTRDECMSKTIRRALGTGIVDGGLAVKLRNDLSPQEFAKVSEVVDNFFKEKGVE